MRRLHIPGTRGRTCGCGALTDEDMSICGKCAARFRWLRRKAPHHIEGDEPCS
ncbi:hypothetical protein [Microbispora bryophytorum]